MEDTERHNFWSGCDLVHSDPEIAHGTPVLKGTRLPADALVEDVKSFMEMDGLTVDQAIAETLDCFPGTPGGCRYDPSLCWPSGGTLASVNPHPLSVPTSHPANGN